MLGSLKSFRRWRKKRGSISSSRQSSGYVALSHERVGEGEDVEKVEKGNIKTPGWSLVETVGIGVGWGPRSPRPDLSSCTRTATEVSIPFLALPQGAELGRVWHRHRASTCDRLWAGCLWQIACTKLTKVSRAADLGKGLWAHLSVLEGGSA